MLCLCFPFCDEESTTFEELCLNVKAGHVEFPDGVSSDAKDLIKKLLAKNRISIDEIRLHKWWQLNEARVTTELIATPSSQSN